MTAPTIEALRRAYEAGRSSTFRDGQTDCRPANDGHHDAGLKAVAEAGRKAHAEAIHEALVRTVTERNEAVAERDAARAKAAELDRRLAAEEDGRSVLKEALCREEERRYAAEREAERYRKALERIARGRAGGLAGAVRLADRVVAGGEVEALRGWPGQGGGT